MDTADPRLLARRRDTILLTGWYVSTPPLAASLISSTSQS
jgi:hypothetical protein